MNKKYRIYLDVVRIKNRVKTVRVLGKLSCLSKQSAVKHSGFRIVYPCHRVSKKGYWYEFSFYAGKGK